MSHVLYPSPQQQSWPLDGARPYPRRAENVPRVQVPRGENGSDEQPLDFSKKKFSEVVKPDALQHSMDLRLRESPPVSPNIFAMPPGMPPAVTNGSLMKPFSNNLHEYHEAISRLNVEIPRDSSNHVPPCSPPGFSAATDRIPHVSASTPFMSPVPGLPNKPNGVPAFSPPNAPLGIIDPRYLTANKELFKLGTGYYPGAVLGGNGILRAALQPSPAGENDDRKGVKPQARPFKSYNPLPSNLPIVPLNILSDYEDQEYRFQQFIEQYNARKEMETKRSKPTPQESVESHVMRGPQTSADGSSQSPSTSGQVDSSPPQRLQPPPPSDVSSDASEGPPNSLCRAADTSTAESTNKNGKRSRTLPEELKDAAYWERRKKNNEAAKRSRDSRRQKEDCIAMRAKYLETENQRLWNIIGILQQQLSTIQCCAAHNHSRM